MKKKKMRKHRVIINILVLICVLMTLPPMMMYGTAPIIVLDGMLPLFAVWIFGWSFCIVCLLILLYFLDKKYENREIGS